MNRRKFLRRITVGAAAVVATPVLLADIGKQKALFYLTKEGILIHQGNCGPASWISQAEAKFIYDWKTQIAESILSKGRKITLITDEKRTNKLSWTNYHLSWDKSVPFSKI